MNQKQEFNESDEMQEQESEPQTVSSSAADGHPSALPIIIQGVKPSFTYGILALTVAVFILQEATTAVFGLDMAAALGMKINSLIRQGEVWRLLTPVFLHGSILHIALNMYALYILGQSLEPPYGHFRFLMLYLLAGFCGNVFSTVFSPYPSLGSSTAVFGLIAAQGIFILKNRQFFGKHAQRALVNIAAVSLLNFIIGLSPGIDNWGHLGGFLGGAAIAWFAGPVLQGGIVQTKDGLALVLADERSATEQLLAILAVGGAAVGIAAWAVFFH